MRIAISILACLLVGGTALAQSLVPNGDFEQGNPSRPQQPAHWDILDGLGVRWTDAPTVPGSPPHGKAIRMDTSISEADMNASWSKAGITKYTIPKASPGPIAETYGLSLYSDPVPITPGKAYRIGFDYMSESGTAGKLWFRGYGTVGGEERRLYEGVIDCTSTKTWKHFTGLFHPTRHNANVTEFRVMLYAYYPAGVAWFDNVTVEEVDDPAPP